MRRPVPSLTENSDSASDRPAWINRDRPTSRPLSGVIGRRKFIVRSDVARARPGGRAVTIEPPAGASAKYDETPIGK
jgi:hypothetical protein